MSKQDKTKKKAPPEPWAVLRGHETAVNAVALHVPPSSSSTATSATSPAQPLLASGDASGGVWLWSLRTKRRLRSETAAHALVGLHGGGGRVQRQGSTAAGGGGAAAATENEGGVLEVAFVDSGRRLLSQGRGQTSCVRLWDTERMGTSTSTSTSPSSTSSGLMATFPVASLAFCKMSVLEQRSAEGHEGESSSLFAVYGEEQGKRIESEVVTLWDVRADPSAGSQLRLMKTPEARSRMGMCMCLRLYSSSESAGGPPCLATSWENGHLYLWDLRQPDAPYASTAAAVEGELSKGRLHNEPPLAFDLVAGDGRNVRGVSGGADAHIAVFASHLTNSNDEAELDSSTSSSSSASSTGDGSIEVETRMDLGHPGVGSVAVRHSDRRIFATGGWDKRVRVWDFKRPRPLAILKTHTGAVNCLAFSPSEGDNLLVSGSADTRIACWSIY